MKIKDIKEIGFYKSDAYGNDYVFEVIENTDEKWLEECPDATLLLDVWEYDYTDENDRIHYQTSGGIYRLDTDYANIEVEKTTQKYIMPETSINLGCFLVEDKPTYKEIIIKLKDQMKKDIVRYENGEYDSNDFICNIRDYLRMMGELND